MRISDWSSDVCSSDLRRGQCAAAQPGEAVNIGAASQASGVSQRMIRHYEKIGLIPAPLRRDSGYRDYADADVHRLRFRSEEHTSELQSLMRISYDVFCLKKNNINAVISAR